MSTSFATFMLCRPGGALLNCTSFPTFAPSSAPESEPQDERSPSAGAKSLCIPFDQSQFPDIAGRNCPNCGKTAKRWTMFGR